VAPYVTGSASLDGPRTWRRQAGRGLPDIDNAEVQGVWVADPQGSPISIRPEHGVRQLSQLIGIPGAKSGPASSRNLWCDTGIAVSRAIG